MTRPLIAAAIVLASACVAVDESAIETPDTEAAPAGKGGA